MKAMLVDENQNLVWTEVEKPTPKEDEILIEIYNAALKKLRKFFLAYPEFIAYFPKLNKL